MHASLRGAIPALVALALIVWGTGIAQAQVQVIVGERAMPAPIVEVVPAAPSAGHAWIPGHWAWRRGAWFWVKGHHIRGVVTPMPVQVVEVVTVRPSPRHFWVKGHHSWEGARWVWHPGVWIR
jgi:hypothetical protein